MKLHCNKFKLFTLICYLFLGLGLLSAQNYEFAAGMGSVYGSDYGLGIVTDKAGNIYSAGPFRGDCDFDPSPAENIVELDGATDMFIQKLDPNGNLIWIKSIHGPEYETFNHMIIDSADNLYITGSFTGTVDFDPSPGTYFLEGDPDANTFFEMKLDSDGELIWAYQLLSTVSSSGLFIDIDKDMNVYTAGSFNGTMDFDHGPGTTMATSTGVGFIMKSDIDGNFKWVKYYTNVGGISSFYADSSGHLIISGIFTGTVDFDPGPGTITRVSHGDFDTYFTIWDTSGTVLTTRTFGGTDDDISESIFLDPAEDNIYICGRFSTTVDFDPGAGITSLTSNGYTDMFVAKYDIAGNFLWVKQFGTTSLDLIQKAILEPGGNLIVGGNLSGTMDFDPGPGIYYKSGGSGSIYILKLDADGNFISVLTSYGGYNSTAYDVTLDGENNILLTGAYAGDISFNPLDLTDKLVDYNPPGGEISDIFVVKYNQDICANLTLVLDSIKDVSCTIDGYSAVHGEGGAAPYVYEWSTLPVISDSTIHFLEKGSYGITLTDTNSCIRLTTYIIDGPEVSELDLDVHIIAEEFRPGFETNVFVDGYNNGCIAASGDIQLILDDRLIIQEITPEPDIISGDTLLWNFTEMTWDSGHFNVQLLVELETGIEIDEAVHLPITISPMIDDIDTLNNFKDYHFKIVNAIDPNDKSVYPPGVCDAGYILPNTPLIYTIRFQNTGTADAVNIYIDDTISTNLDINSLEVLASSHNMFTELLADNTIRFNFPEIHLPDSTTNETESHGYIVYSINQLPDITPGNTIVNSSAIYFDFNDAVITNSTLNTIIDILPNTFYAQELSICNGESITVGDHVYSAAGTYVDFLSTAFGCDSILTTTLAILNTDTTNLFPVICEGESFTVGASTYITSGSYLDILSNMVGCDSVINTLLTVNPNASSTIDTSICNASLIVFGDTVLTDAGTYQKLYSTMLGCDSLVTLHLSVQTINTAVEVDVNTLTATTSGANYQWIDCNNDNTIIEGATNQSFMPLISGNYAVIINDGFCVDTSACTLITILNINNVIQQNNFAIYPNPVDDQLIISNNNPLITFSITVVNNLGEKILVYPTNLGSQITIDTQLLSAGIYTIIIQSEDYITSKSIIKQ